MEDENGNSFCVRNVKCLAENNNGRFKVEFDQEDAPAIMIAKGAVVQCSAFNDLGFPPFRLRLVSIQFRKSFELKLLSSSIVSKDKNIQNGTVSSGFPFYCADSNTA